MSDLAKRVITAVILLCLAAIWMFFLADDWFDRVACLLGLMMSAELLVMVGVRKILFYALIAAFSWATLLVLWVILPAAVAVLVVILFSMIM